MLLDNLSPRVFWAWNSTIKYEEAIAQLKDFKNKGISGVFVHARAGLDIEYMGESWFEIFGKCVEYCEKIGLEIWIYDEYGWPSGFAGGKVYEKNEEYKERYFIGEFTSLTSIKDRVNNIYKVYDFVDGEFVDCDNYADGKHYFVFLNTNDYYIDVSNKDAIKYFIEVTHEEYKKHFGKYFGNVIKGIFTDEPHLPPWGLPFGKDIARWFEKQNGYELDKAVPYILFEKGDCERYKYSYWKVINKLFKENYVMQYNAWCKENNLIMTGHYACEEGLVEQIPVCGGVMPFYIEMGIPGVDALGNRLIPAVAYKQVQSISRQFGKREILCETYAGAGYDSTFEDLLRIWAYQSSFGVNIPCLSISMYSVIGNRKRDYPQYFSYQMPWWEKSNLIFDSIKNINERLATGETKGNILVIHPKNYCFKKRGYNGNEELKKISSQFRILTENLIDLQTDFDYGDEDVIREVGNVEDGKFKVGQASYNTVIIPDIETEESTKILIEKFIAEGGKVISLNDKLNISGKYIYAVNRRDYLRKLFTVENVFEDDLFLESNTRYVCSGLVVTKRYYEKCRDIFVLNKSINNIVKTTLKTVGQNKITVEYVNGITKVMPSVYSKQDGNTYTEFTINPKEFFFVKIEDGFENIKEEQTVSKIYLDNCFKEVNYTNTFTIDKLCFSVNGGEYSQIDFAIKQNNKFYRIINGCKNTSKLSLKYCFKVKEKIDNLYLACESLGGKVYINGNFVENRGYYLDKNISKYDISKYTLIGENCVIIEKDIPPFYNALLGKDVFQSITNVASFPYCIENIYLLGDFGIESGSFDYGKNCYFAEDFILTSKKKLFGLTNLTKKGLYFYSGTVSSEANANLQKTEKDKYYISIEDINVECVEVFINDKLIDVISKSEKIDITDFLKNGDNSIRIKLYSGLRNLFGPHHHKYGKHLYVGPSVFDGIKEWQDEVVSPELKGETWTDKYSFVEFGISKIFIEQTRNGD